MGRGNKGTYKVRNVEKYIGDVNNVVYRSGWERSLCIYCDNTPAVLRWAIEPPMFVVSYTHPIKQRQARYFPDFYMEVQTERGIEKYLVEVKPYKETIAPVKKQGKARTRLLHEKATYMVNMAKWRAARVMCASRGIQFKLITEKELGNRIK